MPRVFTWSAQYSAPRKVSFRVFRAQFGDGYKQTAADGINNRDQEWALTFKGPEAELDEIAEFLTEHQGHIPFEWTPPRATAAILCECEDFTDDRLSTGSGVKSLSAVFKQRFGV